MFFLVRGETILSSSPFKINLLCTPQFKYTFLHIGGFMSISLSEYPYFQASLYVYSCRMANVVSTKNRSCNKKKIPRHSCQLQITTHLIFLRFRENLHVYICNLNNCIC